MLHFFLIRYRYSPNEENCISARKWFKKKHLSGSFLPERVSSSCEQRREGNPQQRPTTCCGPETAGYQYMDPDRHKSTILEMYARM